MGPARLVRRYLSATAQVAEIQVPQMDLSAMIKAMPSRSNQTDTNPVHLDLPNMDMHMPRYRDMQDTNGYPEILVADHLSWTANGLIALLIILCIIAGIWVYRRGLQIKFFFKDALKGAKLAKLRVQLSDKVIEQELVEIKSVAPDSEETGV